MEERYRFTDLLKLLQVRADGRGDHPAFSFLKQGETLENQLTFAELEHRARAIGAYLQSRGPVGSRALLVYPQGLAFIEAFLGCLYAGFIAVPVNAPLSRRRRGHGHRLAKVMDDCDAAFVLCTADTPRLLVEDLAAENNKTMIKTDDIGDGLAAAWQAPGIDESTIAFLQYTSGSTSDPKGVMVTHANLLHNLELMRTAFGNNQDTVMVSWLPLFHDLGLIGGVLQTLYLGASCYLMAPAAFLQKPVRWLQAISRYRATSSMSPNFGYELCIRRVTESDKKNLDLSCWTHAPTAAEPIRAATLEGFHQHFAACGFQKRAFYPGYGLAEATLVVTAACREKGPVIAGFDREALARGHAEPVEEPNKDCQELVSSGRLWGGQELLIVRPESRTPLPDGQVGEVWVKGPSVARGYCNRVEATQDTFEAHLSDTRSGPFLRTGDLGFLADGELFITGRLKELIIIHGKNHYPQDIEHTVQACHPAFRHDHGAAFAIDIDDEEHLVVVQEVERTYRKHINAELLNRVVSAIADEHELEVHEVVLIRPNSLLKTSSGKIQRQRCRELYLKDELVVLARGGFMILPGDEAPAEVEPTEAGKKPAALDSFLQKLIRLIAPMLKVAAKDIRPHQPFTEYGLSSQRLVSISGELSEALNRNLPPTLLYDYPTPKALATFLSDDGDEDVAFAFGRTSTATDEPIAVVGVGCRLPGGISNLEELWALFSNGRDTITDIPSGRWNPAEDYYPRPGTPGKTVARMGSFLEGVDHFDAEFFGISRFEAERMDPRQRMMLEVGWHALEDAGIPPSRLAGSASGVFLGISGNDYGEIHGDHAAMLDAQAEIGNALGVAANRLSFALDLKGPSLAVDTACSSSLTAIHLARQSLRLGECDLAIAGGVHLMLSRRGTIVLSQAQMLSTGKGCRAFDAEADGYVRGEGCGLAVLKRLSDAKRDGDRIFALIRGSAVNQDGRGAGLTVPNGNAMEAVMRRALADAAVAPEQVDFIEAQGTGTPLGDAIEAAALGRVFRQDRPENRPLMIGSSKANLGHLEAASGMCGLFKIILAMRHGLIPATPRIHQPSPQIQWRELKLNLVRRATQWPRRETPRLAGLNAFGIGGANASLILQEPPAPDPVKDAITSYSLLTLSAKSDQALQSLARAYRDYLQDFPERSLVDCCFSAFEGRDHFTHRLALVCATRESFRDGLSAFLENEPRPQMLYQGNTEGEPLAEMPVSEMRDARDHQADQQDFLLSLAQFYTQGGLFRWADVHPGQEHQKYPLPNYPFARVSYWIGQEEAFVSPFAKDHPLLGEAQNNVLMAAGQHLYEARVSPHQPPFLSDVRTSNRRSFPVACLLEMAFAAADKSGDAVPVSLRDVALRHPPTVSDDGLWLQTLITPDSDKGFRFDIFASEEGGNSSWRTLTGGRIQIEAETLPHPDGESLPCFDEETIWDKDRFYETCGLNPGPAFRAVSQAFRRDHDIWARVSLPAMLLYSRPFFRFHPVLLEACFQLLYLFKAGSSNAELAIGAIEEARLWGEVDTNLWVHVRGLSLDAVDLTADLDVRDEDGRLLARIAGIRFRFHAAENSITGSTSALDLKTLQTTPRENRAHVLNTMLVNLLADTFKFDQSFLLENRALNRAGLDSLMAIQLKHRIQQDLDVVLSVPELLKDATPADLTSYLLGEMFGVRETSAELSEPAMNDDHWVEVLV